MKTQRAKHERLVKLMKARYSAPAWGLLWEVPNGTGHNKSRTADAMAMSLWPSRGLELHGFELKTVRSDWLGELKNPAKAEALAKYCDRWWIVAEPGVVEVGELPPSWGLIERRGSVLRVQREAAAHVAPVEPDTSFLASLFRAVSLIEARHSADYIKRSAVSAELELEYQRGVGDSEASAKRKSSNATAELEDLKTQLAKFEESSGVKIDRFCHAEKIGAAVKLVLDGGTNRRELALGRAATTLEDVAARIRVAIATWKSSGDGEC